MNTSMEQASPVTTDPYLAWLKNTRRIALFECGGVWWRPYHRALVPASLKPEPLQLTAAQAADLLEKSGTLFLRCFTKRSQQRTDFWYTECPEYQFEALGKDMRRHIRRAHERCEVRPIDAKWLAANGYECYTAAFERYKGARPDPEAQFVRECLEAVGGPIEFWGVFVDGRLAGYTKMAVGPDYAQAVVTKLHARLLSHRPGYALRDSILRNYVTQQGKVVMDGFRAITHETNQHDHLLKFGYRRVYCDLCVVYRPAMRAVVRLLYPFKPFVDRMPASQGTVGLKGVLMQEQIRRSFL